MILGLGFRVRALDEDQMEVICKSWRISGLELVRG